MNLYINCSPKKRNSNSNYFINLVKNENDDIFYLYEKKLSKEILNKYNTIIFVFPLYIDTFPSKLIEFFEQFDNLKNKKVYSICNCGFLEFEQCNLVTDNLKYIVNKKNGNFMGYLNIGCGEIIGITKKRKILKIFCLNFFKKIKQFKNDINNNNKTNLNTNIKLLNKKLFCLICNHYFKKRTK